jgi:hypothetical protein
VPADLDLDHARLVVSPGALLSLQRTVELIPVGTQAERREWLRKRGLVRYLFDRPVVRWSDVLDALEGDRRPEPRARPSTGALPRIRL